MPVLIPVSKLQQLCNPYGCDLWNVGPISRHEVETAILTGALESLPIPPNRKQLQYHNLHVRRIAYLVTHGWSDAIEVDIGIPSHGYFPSWVVQDGNHRLAAAIFRGDESILGTVCGSIDYGQEVLGIDITEADHISEHETVRPGEED